MPTSVSLIYTEEISNERRAFAGPDSEGGEAGFFEGLLAQVMVKDFCGTFFAAVLAERDEQLLFHPILATAAGTQLQREPFWHSGTPRAHAIVVLWACCRSCPSTLQAIARVHKLMVPHQHAGSVQN